MYHTTLTLFLSLFTIHLKKNCWAQELTFTTDALEIATPSIDSNTIDGGPTDFIGEPMSFVISETTPVPLESFSVDFPSETPSIDPFPVPEPTSTDPIPTQTSDFAITLDRDVYDDCDVIDIAWSGTGISPPYLVSYYTGTGNIGDTSILEPESPLTHIYTTSTPWSGPPFGFTPLGNVIYFTVMERGGRIATKWIPWHHGKTVPDCEWNLPNPQESPDMVTPPESSSDPPIWTESTSEAISIPVVTLTQDPNVEVVSPISAMIQISSGEPKATSTSNPMQIVAPIPATRTQSGSAHTVTLLANDRTGNGPQLSRENNSMGNQQRPSISAQSTPQALNDENEEPIDRFETTMLIPLGDGLTMTMVSGGPRGTGSASISSGVQQYTAPAMSDVPGRSNDVRNGLPPAAIGAIVGSLLGALALWILLVVWLKKRKRSQGFQELEDPAPKDPSTKSNRRTSFISPPPAAHNAIYTNSNRQSMQEVGHPTSPVTSIADTVPPHSSGIHHSSGHGSLMR